MSSVESKRSELDKLLSSDEEDDEEKFDTREHAKKSPLFVKKSHKIEATKKEYSPSDFTFEKSNEEEKKCRTISAKVSSHGEGV